MSADVDTTSGDQIDELFAHYHRTRDPATRNRLVEHHLPIADRCARRYMNRGEPLADLVQVARMALVRSVERFDPDRGVSFEGYALPTMLGELRHHFRDNCWAISVPRRAKDLRSQVFRTSEQMSQRLGRQPAATEIAEELGMGLERVTSTLEANRHYRATSWESLTDPNDGSASVREAADPTTVDDSADRIDIAQTIAALDERLQQIVVWRYYEECTQREIGSRLGIGQVQVSRLLSSALGQLRRQLDPSSTESADHATSVPA